jgi:hypothetical protein
LPLAADAAVIVCPLQHEARLLRRALRGCSCAVECCGPGPAGVRAWADARNTPMGIVILAGLAGSLRIDLPAGEARIIAEARDEHGSIIARPSLTLPMASCSATITQAPSPITMQEQRRALASCSGADMVDMESAEFARQALNLGWRWAIVRGISDDPHTGLPVQVTRWTDARGRTKPLAVALDVLRQPSLARDLRRLRSNSRRALADCAAHVRTLLEIADEKSPET